jgi:Mn2+/Fe2+ NRAMP family transporter
LKAGGVQSGLDSSLSIRVLFSSIGFKPLQVITFAQVANGLLLPIMYPVMASKYLHFRRKGLKNNVVLNIIAVVV